MDNSYFSQLCASKMVGLAGVGAAVLLVSAFPSRAQSVVVFDVEPFEDALFPSYQYEHNGSVALFPYYGFHLTVTSGTGDAEPLEGGNYFGFCVNTFYGDPVTGEDFTFGNDAASLSYTMGATDFWDIARGLKFNALKDVLANYADELGSLDQSTQEFADLVTGIGLATSEILLDYDGTTSSMNLGLGGSIVSLSPGVPLTSGGAFDVYQNLVTNVIGTGVGASASIYAASRNDTAMQDVMFLSVPEPSGMMLALLGGCLVSCRRKRSAA